MPKPEICLITCAIVTSCGVGGDDGVIFSLPPGFSSHVALQGSKAVLRCNNSAWSEDATVIIWFRGLSGPAIYSFDRRSSYEKIHSKGEAPAQVTDSANANELDSNSNSNSDSNLELPERERLFIDRSSDVPALVLDPLEESDSGDYR